MSQKARIVTDPEAGGGQLEDGSGSVQSLEIEEEYQPCFIKYITVITRTVALLTVVLLWCITSELMYKRDEYNYQNWYSLAISIFMTVFESIWIFNKCFMHIKEDSCRCCCRCWSFFVWIDNWKKSILYIGIAVPCFIDSIIIFQTIIEGVFILVTAVFYFIRSFKNSKCVQKKKYKYLDEEKQQAIAKETQTSGEHAQDYGTVGSEQAAPE